MKNLAVCLTIVACVAMHVPHAHAEDTMLRKTPLMGATGGAYFLCEPGELLIDLVKHDRNRSGRTTQLQAILVGRDRQVIETVRLDDDGQSRGAGLGPAQHAVFRTVVPAAGVYGLNVTVSNDRYGDDILWGFTTNCKRFMIETARGHRDERRREPIVLRSPEQGADICFIPRRAAFTIEMTGQAAGKELPVLYDEHDQPVATFVLNESTASCRIEVDANRSEQPWRLHVPASSGFAVSIDGVTQWDSGDHYINLPYWTTSHDAFFPLQKYRWPIRPYRQTVCDTPGSPGQATFCLHNNSPTAITLGLAIEEIKRPEPSRQTGQPWSATLSTDRVTLSPNESKPVTISYDAPPQGEERSCRLRATPEGDELATAGMTTYSTLMVRSGDPASDKPLELPLQLSPYEHENQQLGHVIDFPTDNQVYFSPDNRPMIRTDDGVAVLRDGQWSTTGFQQLGFPTSRTSKIAFDAQGNTYTLASAGPKVALMRSRDGGKTFDAHIIPNGSGSSCTFDIDQFSGHNTPTGPPAIVRYTRRSGSSDPKLRWRTVQDLELILAHEDGDGQIVFEDPVLLTWSCIGISMHSGIPSTVVSRGDQVHVAWGEATDPADNVPGVPSYVATYDRVTKIAGPKTLIGYGAPANDIHNTPSITIDGKGYLHALIGTHGRPFQYLRSLESNDAAGGWSESELMGHDLQQTYVGMVCGPDGTIHVAYRYWQRGVEPYPLSHHGTLAYQQKRPGEPWSEPQILLVAPLSEYSIFYHRLTIDRRGRLMLSYDYWSTYWFYRTDHFGDRRNLMLSPDGGKTWHLAKTNDLR